MLVDTHFHLEKEYYDDIDTVISEARDNTVDTLIMSACDKQGILEGLGYLNKYDNLYMTVGFHPEEVENISDDDLEWLENVITMNSKIVGIGEIGLDYYYTKENKDKQLLLFKKQLKLAEKLNMPVVIHSREAFLDTYNMLKEFKGTGIIHCFTSNIENAKKYIDLGFKLGFGGVVTFKNSNLKDVVKELSLNDIVLETDSPYLSPEPFRGKINGPKNVFIIAKKIAEIKGISVEKVGEITFLNVAHLFDLDT